jgi:hypothetical protein
MCFAGLEIRIEADLAELGGCPAAGISVGIRFSLGSIARAGCFLKAMVVLEMNKRGMLADMENAADATTERSFDQLHRTIFAQLDNV